MLEYINKNKHPKCWGCLGKGKIGNKKCKLCNGTGKFLESSYILVYKNKRAFQVDGLK